MEDTYPTHLANAAGPASPVGLTPPDEYVDPISGDVMQDPVILGSTGQTYERSTIMMWLQRCARENREVTDPLTGVGVGSSPAVGGQERLVSMLVQAISPINQCVSFFPLLDYSQSRTEKLD